MEMSLNTTRRLVFIRGFDFGRVGLIKSPAPPTLVFLVCGPVEVASPHLCPQLSTICLPLTGNTLGDVLLADLGEGGAAGEPGCRWGSGGSGSHSAARPRKGAAQSSVIRLMRRRRHAAAPRHCRNQQTSCMLVRLIGFFRAL